jgi:hypothetical protein
MASSEYSLSGLRIIFAFLGLFVGLSFPVWLYFIGFYLWGDGYISRFFKKIILVPIKTILNLNKILFFIFFFVIYLVILFSYFNPYQAAVVFGESFGTFLGCTLLLWILIATINKVKGWKINKDKFFVPLFAIILTLSLVKEIYYTNEAQKTEIAIKEEWVTFSNNQTKPVIYDSDKKYKIFAKQLLLMKADSSAKVIDLINNLEPENISNSLAPRNLQNKDKTAKIIKNVRDKLLLVNITKDEIDSIYKTDIKNMAKLCSNLGFSDKFVESFIYGAEKKYIETKPLINKKITLIENELRLFEEILTFFIKNHKRFVIDKNKILFMNESDLNLYNSYIEKLEDYSKQEDIIEREWIEAQNSLIKKINESN